MSQNSRQLAEQFLPPDRWKPRPQLLQRHRGRERRRSGNDRLARGGTNPAMLSLLARGCHQKPRCQPAAGDTSMLAAAIPLPIP